MLGETTTHLGLQTCDTINASEAETSKQGISSKDGSDPQTEQRDSAICEDRRNYKDSGRDQETHSESQLPDGVREASGGELEAFRLRCARLE